MECDYGVGITNRFSRFLLISDGSDDEDSNQDVIKTKLEAPGAINDKDTIKSNAGKKPEKGQPEKHTIGKDSKLNKENGKGAPSSSTASRREKDVSPKNISKSAPAVGGRNNRGDERMAKTKPEPFGKDEENMERRNNCRNENPRDRDSGTGGDFGEHPMPRQNRGGGGRGGQRPFRGREFDRKSGSDRSGVKPVDKKQGAGQRNWGSYKEDADEPAGNEALALKMLEKEMEDIPEEVEHLKEEKQVKDSAEPEVEPVKLMTLDEYKALQTNQRQKPTFNVRKAGEGEDQSWMKKMTLVKKTTADEETEEEEDYDIEYPRRYGRQKQLVDIKFRFADSRPSRRGARGLGRGVGGFRGEQRGGHGGAGASGSGFGDIGTGGDRGDKKDDGEQPPATTRTQDCPDRSYATRSFEFRNSRGRQIRPSKPRVDDERDFPSLTG